MYFYCLQEKICFLNLANSKFSRAELSVQFTNFHYGAHSITKRLANEHSCTTSWPGNHLSFFRHVPSSTVFKAISKDLEGLTSKRGAKQRRRDCTLLVGCCAIINTVKTNCHDVYRSPYTLLEIRLHLD